MVRACHSRLLYAQAAILVPIATGQTYSKLNSGSLCSDYKIDDVVSENECFDTAASQLGLDSFTTLAINGLGFTGCVLNVDANILFYGTSSPGGLTLSTWEYICNGVPTTTTTTTRTISTVVTTSFVVAGPGYSLLDYYETCADYKIADLASADECFNDALPYLGLTNPTISLNGLGFTGCILNTDANTVLFSISTGGEGATAGNWKYICKGTATTTTTTSTTTTQTSTTTTSTTSTSTVTTSTVTTSTSTLTTTTSTTSTKTTSTSTRSTSTYTGSSSTTTSVTFTTTTETQTTTETSSTSTRSTATTTFSERAGFVGDDPLTLYGGAIRKFWLPDKEFVPLLQTSELHLLGAAISNGTEQWINRLVVTSTAGDPVLQVAIRSDIATSSRDNKPSDSFKTLNVTLDWLGGLSLKAIPPPEAYAYQWGRVVFAFGRVASPHFKIGEAEAEMVVVEGASCKIVLMSNPANGFEGELAHLAAEYAHLDFVLQMRSRDTCEGILPELWGVRPLSNSTKALLEQPQ
mmetsp:Transcript_81535/g.225817  ORF Transcript_81535/g.225817 Transcript_81535/m.225817 type:complete len:522 (-) Transcript_81535:20-1585(-)